MTPELSRELSLTDRAECDFIGIFRAGLQPAARTKLSENLNPLGESSDEGCITERVFSFRMKPRGSSRERGSRHGNSEGRASFGLSRVSSAGNVCAATTRKPRKGVSSGDSPRPKLPPAALRRVSIEELQNSKGRETTLTAALIPKGQGKPAHCFESKGQVSFLSVNYAQYLQSDHWRNLRFQKERKTKKRCAICGDYWKVDLHHLFYRKSWFAAELSDLRWLCRRCHTLTHEFLKSGELKLTQPENHHSCFALTKLSVKKVLEIRKQNKFAATHP